MKRIFIYCLFIVINMNSIFAQEFNEKYIDKRVGSEILIDQCNRDGLKEGTFGVAFNFQYAGYNSDIYTITKLKNHLENITIKLVFGSWCYDSEIQVPRFIKVLDEIGFDDLNLTIIAVDRLKKSHELSIDDLKIKYVPTFIIYKNDNEIGRIVENPKISLEMDLLKILQKEQ
ncbi:MAG: thioredoxin family protein [Bacteroidetes bacterium]|nr:thioredoxin family protein [Bacteroidota bacterium]